MKKIYAVGLAAAMLGSIVIVSPVLAGGPDVIEVRLEDRCDKPTFNAVGIDCDPLTDRGTDTFEEVLAELNPVDFGPDHWRFSRTDFSIKKGDVIRSTNTGGEAHSFTAVPAFGGGCVRELNDPLGLTDVTANCPDDFGTLQFPGQTTDIAGLSVGEHKFMCIIHPWMRATVEVESD